MRLGHLRYRATITLLALLVVVLGLVSRSSAVPAASFVGRYSGDTLWALLVYLLVRWLLPEQPVIRAALSAGLFALAVETSQLYHAPWLDAIRRTRPGHLVLGAGFLWSDLLCYSVGILIGALVERGWHHRMAQPNTAPPPGSAVVRPSETSR